MNVEVEKMVRLLLEVEDVEERDRKFSLKTKEEREKDKENGVI